MDFPETRMSELVSLQDRTKYNFLDLKLLNKALTHKSYANEKTENLKHNNDLRCGSRMTGGPPWTYGTGHEGCTGVTATVDAGTGVLGSIGSTSCTASHQVGCCF